MDFFVVGWIIGIVIVLILEVIVANQFESIANEKGYSGYFWWCFFLNIIGYLMVIALPNKQGNDNLEREVIATRQLVFSIEHSQTMKGQQSQPQYQQPQQTYWNNNLPPL